MTPFDIVLVPFPFSDLSAVKRRPCLVLAAIHARGLGAHFIVAMMTSNTSHSAFPDDVVLRDWKGAGLPKKTLVRLAKVVTLDSSLIGKRIGRIEGQDQKKIRSAFRRIFASVL